MKTVLQRILDSIVAIVMVGLSLVLQAFFFLLLGFGIIGVSEVAGHKIESDAVIYSILGALFLLFNGLTCYIYFKHNRADVRIGKTSSAFFYVPRAIDTIVFGSQRVSRSRGVSDISPEGESAQPAVQREREDASR